MEIKYYLKSLTLHIRVRTRHRVREKEIELIIVKRTEKDGYLYVQEVVHELEVIETDEEQNEIDEAQK